MKAKGGQKNMDAKEVTRPKAAVPLLSFLILCVLLSTTPLAAELYTRTDELSCGDAKVQAVTTCTRNQPAFSRVHRAAFSLFQSKGRDFREDKSIGRAGRRADRRDDDPRRVGRGLGVCQRESRALCRHRILDRRDLRVG